MSRDRRSAARTCAASIFPSRPPVSLFVSLASTLVASLACSEPLPDPIEIPCTPPQPAPYAQSSYTGVHANRENNDVIACASGSAFREVWHALRGLAIAQPNTFSPDGRTTYVTTANPDPTGCRLHALDVATGNVVWCKSYPQSIVGSAVEVDDAGDLYFTAERFVHSLAPDGSERWSAEIGTAPMMADEFGTGPLGVHFTPGGHVATVTNDGTVVLVARDDGRVLASLSIPMETGFVPPRALAAVDLTTLLPPAVVEDLTATFGASGGGGTIGAFLGAGGGFSDNTIGISSRDEIFVIGGGPDDEHGALVQVLVAGGATPSLAIGWHLVTNAGSATSPSITPDGRFVSVGDGSNVAALLDPRTAMGRMIVADVDACDANTDGDPDPSVCAGAYEVALERGPIAGSPPLLPDGTLVFWEASPNAGVFGPELRDVAVVGSSGVLWESVLEGGLDWTSVITITDTHLLGTASAITPSTTNVLSVRLPARLESFAIALDRETGREVWRAPITDDSTATVTIGPRGDLFAGLFGLFSILAIEDRPTLGLVRFAPTAR